jgi:hypothetical protein
MIYKRRCLYEHIHSSIRGIYKLKNTARVGVDLTNVKPISVAVYIVGYHNLGYPN